ncbi:Titin [Bienertia sinuspersici]
MENFTLIKILVKCVSNLKYTVRCSDDECPWRLHASKLVNGVAWTIKSITGTPHKCMGLQTCNPIGNTKWAMKALLEDIRANNEIPAKALNMLYYNAVKSTDPNSNILQQGRGNNWCILFDRHKAIEKACSDLWPEVGRRYCLKHPSVNWKKVFPGPKMWQQFWLACGAFFDFDRWAKNKLDPTLKCDVNKTYFVESFNATLEINRTRPFLTLLEGLRRVTMVRLATRRDKCEGEEGRKNRGKGRGAVHQGAAIAWNLGKTYLTCQKAPTKEAKKKAQNEDRGVEGSSKKRSVDNGIRNEEKKRRMKTSIIN